MAINKLRLAQQFNEIAAVSAAEQVTRILHDLALVPGAKQFARNRDLANERWIQLRDLANSRLGVKCCSQEEPKEEGDDSVPLPVAARLKA